MDYETFLRRNESPWNRPIAGLMLRSASAAIAGLMLRFLGIL